MNKSNKIAKCLQWIAIIFDLKTVDSANDVSVQNLKSTGVDLLYSKSIFNGKYN